MTQITPTSIIIEIPTASPKESRNGLIATIASVIRWRASIRDQHDDDENSLATLSELLRELSDCND